MKSKSETAALIGKDKGIKLAIVGSRSIDDFDILWNFGLGALDMTRIRWPHILKAVSGGALGVDSFVGELTKRLWLDEPIIHKPDYKKYGRYEAPKVRNQKIVDNCDAAIVIWDEWSGGTYDTLHRLNDARKPYILIKVIVKYNPKEYIVKEIQFNTMPRWENLYEDKIQSKRNRRKSSATS